MATITINVPSIKPLTNKVKSLFTRPAKQDVPKKAAKYGCMKERTTGQWYAYWVLGGECHVVQMPEGVNAKAYAKANMDTVPSPETAVSYECNCDKCAGTGHAYGGKCFKCDGKGWLSPIDQARAKVFEKKIKAEKAKATRAKRAKKAAA